MKQKQSNEGLILTGNCNKQRVEETDFKKSSVT